MLPRPLAREGRMSDTEKAETRENTKRVQLHLTLLYKHQPRDHPRIREYLDRGFRITQLQRVTDHEVIVTLQSS